MCELSVNSRKLSANYRQSSKDTAAPSLLAAILAQVEVAPSRHGGDLPAAQTNCRESPRRRSSCQPVATICKLSGSHHKFSDTV